MAELFRWVKYDNLPIYIYICICICICIYIVTRKVLLRLNGLKSTLKCLGKNIFLSFFFRKWGFMQRIYIYIGIIGFHVSRLPIRLALSQILIGFLYSIRRGRSSRSIQRTLGWLRTKAVRDAAKERKLPEGLSHGWEDFLSGANRQPMHQVSLCDLVSMVFQTKKTRLLIFMWFGFQWFFNDFGFNVFFNVFQWFFQLRFIFVLCTFVVSHCVAVVKLSGDQTTKSLWCSRRMNHIKEPETHVHT